MLKVEGAREGWGFRGFFSFFILASCSAMGLGFRVLRPENHVSRIQDRNRKGSILLVSLEPLTLSAIFTLDIPS